MRTFSDIYPTSGYEALSNVVAKYGLDVPKVVRFDPPEKFLHGIAQNILDSISELAHNLMYIL